MIFRFMSPHFRAQSRCKRQRESHTGGKQATNGSNKSAGVSPVHAIVASMSQGTVSLNTNGTNAPLIPCASAF